MSEPTELSEREDQAHALGYREGYRTAESRAAELRLAAQAVTDAWEMIRGDLGVPKSSEQRDDALRTFGLALAVLRAALRA